MHVQNIHKNFADGGIESARFVEKGKLPRTLRDGRATGVSYLCRADDEITLMTIGIGIAC